MTKIFPSIMIALSVAASIVYALDGWSEWRKAAYWAFAAGITYVVTW